MWVWRAYKNYNYLESSRAGENSKSVLYSKDGHRFFGVLVSTVFNIFVHTLPAPVGVDGRMGQVAGCCECDNEPSRFVSFGEFPDRGTVSFSRMTLLHGYGAE
jgi:hypothetical protein